MFKIVTRLLPLLLLCLFHSGGATAQQNDRAPNLKLGDAVVTGFSGTIAPASTTNRPRNQSVIDLTFIDPDGPSVRVVDVSKPGYVWDGRLFAAPKTFDVFAKDVGQVFGVALDDSAQPNIYVAATSVFGLNIVSRGRGGLPERMNKGGPGAGWMKGQFGLDLQGGPGGIYKIDGRTGVVTLFANVTLDGVPNPAPGLGNLAYDSAHKQLFVSDLYTGMIHRFDLDGKELGAYDHGVTGLGAAKLATVPFNPRNRPNIASERFDSGKPDTWGFAPAARRVWGLAVHEDRLYYSVVSGPQIWSVGIGRDGSFAADPRWELDVPAQAGPLPVSDIAFSHEGVMILAQRALIAGAYDYSAFTRPGEPQVFRISLKGPNDPPSPGRWKLVPEEYAVGFAGNHRNTNGGVALGYGYGADGTLSNAVCDGALWITGQNLRNNPALRSQLEPGGPLVVHGLQGNSVNMLRIGDEPPTASYFVDYDEKFDDPRATGHIGSVRIYSKPCAAGAYVPLVAAIAPIATPISARPQACTPTCICPPGTVLKGRECVKQEACPRPQVFDPATGTCKCPSGTVLKDGKCVPVIFYGHTCKPPMIPGPTPGSCICPPGTVQVNGKCEPVKCQPPLVLDPATGTCVCPQGSVMQDRKCVPQICPPPRVPGPCKCPEGTVQDGGLCVASIDLKIGKEDTPGGGGGHWFNVWVTNVGPAINYTAGSITITENIPAGMTVTGVTGTGWSCVPPTKVGPGTMLCTYNLAGTLPANTSLSNTMVVHYTTTGPGPFVNCATVGVGSSVGVDGNPSNDTACATVTPNDGKGDLGIEKTGGTTPVQLPYYGFDIKVTNHGGAISNPNTITVTDTVPPNMTFNTMGGPGWTCVPPNGGPAGTVITCTYGPAVTAGQVLPVIHIDATATGSAPYPPVTNCANVGTVSGSGYVDSDPSNDQACVTITKPTRSGSLILKKEVINHSPIALPSMTFPVTVICGGIPTNLSLVDGVPQTIGNILLTTSCSVVEGTVTTPPNACPPNTTPTWTTAYVPPSPVTITGPGITMIVRNTLDCRQIPLVPTSNPTCDPSTTIRKGDICACRFDNMLRTSPTMCGCSEGTKFADGKGCVRSIVCRAPLMPNAAGTDCVCGPGLALRQGKCVEQQIVCPKGTVKKGDACVKREREKKERKKPERERPGVSPGDVIRVLPGLIGPGGGGGIGGGGGGGGGAVPGRR